MSIIDVPGLYKSEVISIGMNKENVIINKRWQTFALIVFKNHRDNGKE